MTKKNGERTSVNWKFYQDEHKKWRWKYIMHGKTAAQAYASFAQYEDCVDDARTHGYRGRQEKP